MKMNVAVKRLNETIEHYKRQFERAITADDKEKILKYISKLSRLDITVQNLQMTGIGRIVNGLRKYDGIIGESAKVLVIKWKNIVKIEELCSNGTIEENSDEENQDLSSANDSEELKSSQNITSSIPSTSYYTNNNHVNEPEICDTNNDDSSDHESSYHRHDKSKNKKSKKDKECKKRKESISTDDQGEGHLSKKSKKDHKYESVKIKKEPEKCDVATTFHRESTNHSEENIKKDKKSSHSDKKKDKHRSSHNSESKSHKDKNESKSRYKDKSDSKKKSKNKTSDKPKEENKPSTSSTFTSSSSSSSSKTFEEALLGIEIGKKKQKSKCKDRSSQSSSPERGSSPSSDSPKLAPLNLDPEELIANYKPLPQLDMKKKKTFEDIDPLAKIMKTKNIRTKVYSGNKSIIYTEVPKLLDICVQVIKDNLDALEFTGGVPFEILEPILKHASPDQLYNLEQYNDYLVEDTDKLWKYHCQKEFRAKIPDKNELWRNFYIRCLEERETKLAQLREKVNANQAASTPVRKTQLAYVDTAVKPPRGVAKKQAKFHTASDAKRNILNKSMMGGNSTAEALSSINRSTTLATGVPIALNSSHKSSAAIKKKKAPLMQKAIQLVKSSRRR